MKTVRLSPSKIEQFRKYYDNELNGSITKESVIDSILGVKQFRSQINFGTAYHAIIENGPSRYFNAKYDKYIIREDDMTEAVVLSKNEAKPAIDYHNKYVGSVNECWWEHEIFVPGYKIIVPMRIDKMYGLEMHEIKTINQYKPSYEDYWNSYQWRLYLVALKCAIVQYDIFRYFKGVKDEEYKIELYEFKFYPELRIEENVRNMARLTLEFAMDNGCEKKILVSK